MFWVDDACILDALKAICVVRLLKISLFDILATIFIYSINFVTQLLFLSKFIKLITEILF